MSCGRTSSESGSPRFPNGTVCGRVFKHKYPWGRAVQRSRGNIFGLKHGDRLVLGGPISNLHDLDSVAVPTD
eukprot:3282896-Pyramimonas_sp.AAC.1